jgi:hypothetical protein
VKTNQVVRNYYILPCCLLLLNVCNSLVSYKAELIAGPLLRTGVIIVLVLFGGSLVAFVMAPAIESLVRTLHRSSRRGAGKLGEIVFLAVLGCGIFYVYYQLYIHGPTAILPQSMWN